MSEIIIVRHKRCEGCLFSTTSLADNAAETIAHMKTWPNPRFFCHCHSSRVLCRGFYDAFGAKIMARFRFRKKKGKYWQKYLRIKPGSSTVIIPGKE